MHAHFDAVTDAIRLVLEFQPGTKLLPTTQLETDLGMDSGLMLELIMQLEETVDGLIIDQASISYDQFKSIASVCDYVAAHVDVTVAA